MAGVGDGGGAGEAGLGHEGDVVQAVAPAGGAAQIVAPAAGHTGAGLGLGGVAVIEGALLGGDQQVGDIAEAGARQGGALGGEVVLQAAEGQHPARVQGGADHAGLVGGHGDGAGGLIVGCAVGAQGDDGGALGQTGDLAALHPGHGGVAAAPGAAHAPGAAEIGDAQGGAVALHQPQRGGGNGQARHLDGAGIGRPAGPGRDDGLAGAPAVDGAGGAVHPGHVLVGGGPGDGGDGGVRGADGGGEGTAVPLRQHQLGDIDGYVVHRDVRGRLLRQGGGEGGRQQRQAKQRRQQPPEETGGEIHG